MSLSSRQISEVPSKLTHLERENERLQVELEASHRSAGIIAERVRDQDVEIERLTAALRRIADEDDVTCVAGNPNLWPSTIAKLALSERN